MAKDRAGWEMILYHGTAGSTAATVVTQARDINVTKPKTRSPTTVRGDGTAIPREHEQVIAISAEITFDVSFLDSDAPIAALLAAAQTGGPIALKVIRRTGGIVEFDGDVTLDYDSAGPLADSQTISFTGRPTKESGRDWSDT